MHCMQSLWSVFLSLPVNRCRWGRTPKSGLLDVFPYGPYNLESAYSASGWPKVNGDVCGWRVAILGEISRILGIWPINAM